MLLSVSPHLPWQQQQQHESVHPLTLLDCMVILTRCTESLIRLWTPPPRLAPQKFLPKAVKRRTSGKAHRSSYFLPKFTTSSRNHMRSRCLGVPQDTDTFLRWGLWHYTHLLNTYYIYPAFGTSCSVVLMKGVNSCIENSLFL